MTDVTIQSSIGDADEQVTPMAAHACAERSYLRKGAVVRCFSVSEQTSSIYGTSVVLSDTPVFTLPFESAELASAFMNDLYYGEYTGG